MPNGTVVALYVAQKVGRIHVYTQWLLVAQGLGPAHTELSGTTHAQGGAGWYAPGGKAGR